MGKRRRSVWFNPMPPDVTKLDVEFVRPPQALVDAATPTPVIKRVGTTSIDINRLADLLVKKCALGQLEGRDLVVQVIVDTLLVADAIVPIESFGDG